MKKYITKKIWTVALTVFFLSGCSRVDMEIPKEQKEEKSEGISISMLAPSGELFDIDRFLLEKYEKYSGNKIDLQEVPDDQYTNVLKAKLASGQGPDIAVIWPGANASQFFPERFLDLSGEEWVERQCADAIDNQTFDGHLIGFGYEGENSGWGVVYNKQIFEEAGIEIPGNMAEFLAICEKIQQKGYTPLASTFKEEWTAGIWMALMGSEACAENEEYYEELNTNEAGFSDSEIYLSFIRDFKEAYDRGYMGALVFDSTSRESFLQVFSGEAAMTLSNCTPEVWLADSKIKVREEDFGMFPAPFADNRTVTKYRGGFIRVINKKSNSIEACKDYFQFLAQEENLELYYQAPERMAINPSFVKFREVREGNVFEQQLLENSVGESVEIGETGLMFWDNTLYGHYVIQAALGAITPEEALAEIDEYREKMFQVKWGIDK